MKFKSALVTQVSGSVGGMTGSHNQGGMYFRARSIPTNPNSNYQQTIRGYMAAAAQNWANPSAVAFRADWRNYAANTPILDTLGELRNISGLAMYTRAQVLWQLAGLGIVATYPSQNTLGNIGNLGFTYSEATNLISVAYTDAGDWADTDDGALLIYASRPQNDSIEFFKGPYRFAGAILGDTASPPASPQTVTNPFAAVEDKKVFVMARCVTADGRVSYPFRTGIIAAA